MENKISMTFVANVKVMTEEKHIKLGDIERGIPVTEGYFSRKRKLNSAIPLDIAIKVSAMLDVPISKLIDESYIKKVQIAKRAAEIRELNKQIERLKAQQEETE